MPRAGGVYSAPPGTKGSPNTTIESAKYNALVDDLVADANAARPVTAGGSGSNTAIGGADNFSPASADMPSAATVNLANATGTLINITGTVTITGLGTVAAGAERALVFGGALTLTHNATSLILPGAANITTAAGDIAVMRSLGGGNWRCVGYQRAASPPFSSTSPMLTTPSILNSFSLQSADAGAAIGPIAELFRDSASPAAADLLAQVPFYGRDSAANKELYASIFAKILDPTSTSEDAILAFATIVAGTLATRFNIGAGLYSEGVAGGDKGAGTVNAAAFYKSGVPLDPFESTPQTITQAGSLTIAHGLGVKPRLVFAVLKCVTAEAGYVTGEEMPIGLGADAGDSVRRGMSIVADTTNLNVRYADNSSLLSGINKTNGATFNVTNSSWSLVLRAWA